MHSVCAVYIYYTLLSTKKNAMCNIMEDQEIYKNIAQTHVSGTETAKIDAHSTHAYCVMCNKVCSTIQPTAKVRSVLIIKNIPVSFI